MNTSILIIATMAALLLMEYFVVSVVVCRQMTGTWNALHFIFDYKYWCFAVLNYHFFLSRKEGKAVGDFIISFTAQYLMPRKRNVIQRLRESERILLIEVLSNQKFIAREFGQMPFTLKRYHDIQKAWEQESRRADYGK